MEINLTQEQYLEQKRQNLIDLGLAWDYYEQAEHPMPKVTFAQFKEIFPSFLEMVKPDMEKYWEFWDKKFNING